MEMVVWLPQSALYLLTKCDDRINLPFPRNGCNNNTRQKTLEAFTKELICRYQFFFYIASSSSLITAFLAVQEDGFFLIIRMKIAIVFVERVKSLPRQKSRYHHIDSFKICSISISDFCVFGGSGSQFFNISISNKHSI